MVTFTSLYLLIIEYLYCTALFKLSNLLETIPYEAFKEETIQTMIGTKHIPFVFPEPCSNVLRAEKQQITVSLLLIPQIFWFS